jgi:hypothetical protein
MENNYFNQKILTDPLGLKDFVIQIGGVRYVKTSIFRERADSLTLPTAWAEKHVTKHLARALKHLDGDPAVILKHTDRTNSLKNGGCLMLFSGFMHFLITAPDKLLRRTAGRKRWVKHWQPNVPDITAGCNDYKWNIADNPVPSIQPLQVEIPLSTTSTPARYLFYHDNKKG